MTAVLAHGGHVGPSVPVSAVALRWLVLLATAAVVTWLLRRGRAAQAVATAAVASALITPIRDAVLVAHRSAVTLWLGSVVALLLGRRRSALLGVGVLSGGATALTGLLLARSDRVRLDGLAFDRLVLLKVALLLLACGLGLSRRGRPELAVLLAATVVGSALVLVPTAPPPGRPVVTAAGPFVVTVVPQRPGVNWVHVDADRVVTVDGTRSRAQTGTSGQWVQLTLPAGRSTLHIKEIGAPWEGSTPSGSAVVDTGNGTPVVLDGPECASAWTAAALVRRTPEGCPSGRLAAADGQALVALVGWLAHRGVTGVTVLGDSTPRSRQAAVELEGARERNHLGRRGAVVVTSGWGQAARQLAGTRVPRDGVYLAPWLVSGPLLTETSKLAPLVVLPFDPTGADARRYLSALPAGETPTAAGYAAWGGHPDVPRVFATAPVSILPRDLGHDHAPTGGWFPGGALTDVSGPVQISRSTTTGA